MPLGDPNLIYLCLFEKCDNQSLHVKFEHLFSLVWIRQTLSGSFSETCKRFKCKINQQKMQPRKYININYYAYFEVNRWVCVNAIWLIRRSCCFREKNKREKCLNKLNHVDTKSELSKRNMQTWKPAKLMKVFGATNWRSHKDWTGKVRRQIRVSSIIY